MLRIKELYADDYIVVVEKPGGLLSVPGRGPDKQECVVNQLKAVYPDMIEQPSVHRLDMDTSGLMVLARTKEAHRALSIAFQNREVEKEYIALLDGEVEAETGRIILPFRLDPDNRPYQVYDEKYGKVGETVWVKLSSENGRTRILFRPLTGRTHQLRLHSSHEYGLGAPIVGDRLYGTGTAPGQLKLHASYLKFHHPVTDKVMEFRSEPPF